MADDRVAYDGVRRAVLLIEVLSVVQDNKLHLGQHLLSICDARLTFIDVGFAWVDLEQELDPIVVAVLIVALDLRVLAASRRFDPIVDCYAFDDLR